MPKSHLGAALALALFCGTTAHANSFWFSPPTQLPAYGEVESVAIGDVSGDGRDDLVAVNNAYFSNTWSNRVLVFQQLPDGTLAQPVAVQYTTSYGGARGLVLADVDADGVLDIAAGYSGGIALLRRDGVGGFTVRNIVTNRGGDVLASLDVDRNGVADLIGLSHSGPAAIYYSDGFGGIASQQTLGSAVGGFNDLGTGDLNSDGVADLAVMSGQDIAYPNLTVHRHDGIGGWLAAQNYVVGPNESTEGVAIGDFDDDGRNDVVLSRGRNSPTWLWHYRQDSNGELKPAPNLASYDIPQAVRAADLDRDGRDDIGVLHGGWRRFGFYLQGSGGLAAEQLVAIPYESHYEQQSLAFGDLDGDGCTDVAIASGSSLVRLKGHDCASADLAVVIRSEERRVAAIKVQHLGGTVAASPDVAVEFRSRRFGTITAPPECVAQPGIDRVQAYRCALAALQPGTSKTLRFLIQDMPSVVVSADVGSPVGDPDESNNASNATLSF